MTRALTDLEQSRLRAGRCCFCGCRSFLAGPRGGLAQNVMCADCRATFNDLGPFGFELLAEPLQSTTYQHERAT